MKNYLAGLALLLLCLAGASAANARSGYPPPLHYESVSDTDTVALIQYDIVPTVIDSTSYALMQQHFKMQIDGKLSLLRAGKNYWINSDSLINDSLVFEIGPIEVDSLKEYTIIYASVLIESDLKQKKKMEFIDFKTSNIAGTDSVLVEAITQYIPVDSDPSFVEEYNFYTITDRFAVKIPDAKVKYYITIKDESNED